MRAKLLQDAAALGESSATRIERCGECTSEASQRLFDALSDRTKQTHSVLHMIQRRAPSMTAFQRVIDSHLMQKGEPPIDWRKPLPVVRTVEAPPAADPTAATIPAPPPEFN